MKTYRDLINYSDSIPHNSGGWFDLEALGAILELPELIYEINAIQIERITYKTLANKVIDGRSYHVDLWFFDYEPFAYYAMGGRSSGDHENIKILNKENWLEAKVYCTSLKDAPEETSLDDYLEAEYNGRYVWEFLDVGQQEMFRASCLCKMSYKDVQTEHETWEYGYTPEHALKLLVNHQEWFEDDMRRSNPNVVFEWSEPVLERVIYEKENL